MFLKKADLFKTWKLCPSAGPHHRGLCRQHPRLGNLHLRPADRGVPAAGGPAAGGYLRHAADGNGPSQRLHRSGGQLFEQHPAGAEQPVRGTGDPGGLQSSVCPGLCGLGGFFRRAVADVRLRHRDRAVADGLSHGLQSLSVRLCVFPSGVEFQANLLVQRTGELGLYRRSVSLCHRIPLAHGIPHRGGGRAFSMCPCGPLSSTSPAAVLRCSGRPPRKPWYSCSPAWWETCCCMPTA